MYAFLNPNEFYLRKKSVHHGKSSFKLLYLGIRFTTYNMQHTHRNLIILLGQKFSLVIGNRHCDICCTVCVYKTWTNVFCLLQKLAPWVGLRKINVSYWGWEDASPFTASTLQWLPGEPSDSGFCAYLERAEVAGLKAKPCTANTEGLICEKPVGEKDFLCAFFSLL